MAEQSRGLAGFFRHHGIWAPGVRAFRRMGFTAKAGLITAAFLLPLLVLGYFFYTAQHESIQGSQLEEQGVQYVEHILPVLQAAQELRQLAMQKAVRKPDTDLSAASTRLQEKLDLLVAHDKSTDDALATAASLKPLQDKVALLSKTENFWVKTDANYSAVVGDVLALMETAADGSSLTLDPAFDTYYLMLVGTLQLPRFVEHANRMAALSLAAAEGREDMVDLVSNMAKLEALIDSTQPGLTASANKILGVHGELSGQLDVAGLVDLVRNVRLSSAALSKQPASTEALQALLVAQQKLNEKAQVVEKVTLLTLSTLLKQRHDQAQNKIYAITVGVVLSLLLALYLFYSFFLVMNGGLSLMRQHLMSMAEGDLSRSPTPWGKDEAAQLMHALRATQSAMRKIVSGVRSIADHIAASSEEISHGSHDMSHRTEETSSNLQQASNAVQDMARQVDQTAGITIEAAKLAVENSRVASEGGVIVQRMVHTMGDINESSNRITDILSVIDSIAFQTNILALNAAVEAARAGEQGKGFAVVASEVRALAQRSSSAAKEIRTLITSSVERVNLGAQVVQKAGDTMGEIVVGADHIRSMLEQIASNARSQQQGLAAIEVSVTSLDEMTQQNAALAEETSAAALSLKDRSAELVDEVSRFYMPGVPQ